MKSASFKLRIKALLIDYLCIVLYLFVLFALTMSIYFLFFNGIPEFTEKQSQLIASLTTVVPITIYFTIQESRNSFASFGKKKAGLKVTYLKNPIIGSLIRNILKFLPWQFGHMSVIRGIYNGFESYYVMIVYGLAVLLPIIYIGMAMIRKDHRHIPDIVAKSYVIVNENK
jgi:RDD family